MSERYYVPLFILVVVALAIPITTYAAPPVLGSGGMTNKLKAFPDFDLVCNFDHEQSTLQIDYDISVPFFTMRTPPPDKVIICQERDRMPPNTLGPETAFTLTQITMTPTNPVNTGDNGLRVTTELNHPSVPPGATLVTWEFLVDDDPMSEETLEWHLAPYPEIPMNPVCEDPDNAGVFFDPCVNRMGIPVSAMEADFPDRDVDGDMVNDFGRDGVVFRYTEVVLANGTRLPRTLLFGPCHSGSFNEADAIVCGQGTDTGGNITGIVPVDIEIRPESFNLGSNGTHDIRILGEANLNPPPVAELVVNGTPVTGDSKFTYADVNDDGFVDFRAKVDRKAFAQALGCSSSGNTTVMVTGTFAPESTPFRGADTIKVIGKCK